MAGVRMIQLSQVLSPKAVKKSQRGTLTKSKFQKKLSLKRETRIDLDEAST